MQTETIVFSDIDYSYKEGLLLIKSKSKYGFIDTLGKITIPFVYEKASSFSEEVAAVCLNGKYGYINKYNEVIIPFMYESANDFSEGLAPVMLHGTWRYIDKKNKQHIQLANSINEAHPFSNGLATVYNSHNKGGYINQSGDLVIPDIYEYADSFKDGIALVESGPYVGYINSQGTYVIPSIHYNGLNCCKGMVSVLKEDDKWSVFDKDGKEVSHFESFEYVDIFQDGFALVKQNRKYGITDIDGKIIIPCIYDYSIVYKGDLFCVCHNSRWGAVDKNHNIVIPFKYMNLQPLSENRYLARLEAMQTIIIDETDKAVCRLSPKETKAYKRFQSLNLVDKTIKIWGVFLGIVAITYVFFKIISAIWD